MIFKWYKDDFKTSGKSFIDFIYDYAPESIRDFMNKHKGKLRLKNIEYDWGLNASEQVEN